MRRWALLAVLMLAVQMVQASRILFLSPMSVKSQKNFYMAIVNTLADKGHQVTVVSPYMPSKVRENVREVVLPDVALTRFLPNQFEGHKFAASFSVMRKIPINCNDALAKQETQDLLKEKFDVVLLSLFFSDCFLSVVHQLKVPYIYVSPVELVGPYANVMGSPRFPSFAHSLFFTATHPYSFTERMKIAVMEVVIGAMYNYILLNPLEQECWRRALCPPDMPSFAQMHRNASLVLVNSVRTMENPIQPSMPSAVHCGGIHCHPAQPLPQELEEWVAGAGDAGFIFFSLGSAVNSSSLPEEYRRILVQVFGSLEQRVLWKWDQDTMEDLPPNMRLGKWLPQQDILGDQRLRLFITHGGLLSTQESMYHGVPVLGMPVFGDQPSNMIEVEQDGWGSVLLWKDLTPEAIKEKISLVMNDKSMKAEAKRRSAVFQDQPQTPGETVSYWVEYVIRHHGAPHLTSPVTSMPWYQVYNVDVWAVVVIAVGLFLYALFRLLWAVCLWLCSPKPKTKLN